MISFHRLDGLCRQLLQETLPQILPTNEFPYIGDYLRIKCTVSRDIVNLSLLAKNASTKALKNKVFVKSVLFKVIYYGSLIVQTKNK